MLVNCLRRGKILPQAAKVYRQSGVKFFPHSSLMVKNSGLRYFGGNERVDTLNRNSVRKELSLRNLRGNGVSELL
jgi:hypothetical protein